MRVAAHVLRTEADLHQKLSHALAPFRLGQDIRMDDPGLGNQLIDRHARIERLRRILEHHLQVAAQLVELGWRHGEEVAALPQRAAAVGFVEAQQDTRQRRLARAALADDGHGLAGHEIEGQAFQGLEGAITLAHVTDRENRLGANGGRMHLALAGGGGNELFGIGMLRVLVDLAHRAGLDQNAFLHHHDVVGDLGDDTEIMGNDEDRHSGLLLQFLEQGEHLGLHGDVECRRRLIGDQKVRTERQRHGDHDALTLTAGEFVRIFVQRALGVGDADPRQKSQCLRPSLGGMGPVSGERLPDLPADGIDRVEVAQRVLEDHGDAAPVDLAPFLRRHRQQVDAVEQYLSGADAPRRHVDQVHDRRGRDRLAGPAFTEDRQGLAAVEVVGDVADRLHDADCGVEFDRKVADFQEMVSHSYDLSVRGASAAPDRARCAASSTGGSATWW
ncbi:hypothetical protein D9M68_328690 [compost metagenome]